MKVFGCKPKKLSSIKPSDKRRISLLNSDFKIITGIDAARFKKVATHTISPMQLVFGEDHRIHHCINLARDAIQGASKNKSGWGILDLDFVAAFDFLVMKLVYLVLLAKGLDKEVVNRISNIYNRSFTLTVVNNVIGKAFKNSWSSLRQGDIPSMCWFSYAIDPLLIYLEKRLTGIPVFPIPVLGPREEDNKPIQAMEENYKIIGNADDVKPSITSMAEFSLVDKGASFFEQSSGCRLHRDPAQDKCKFLALGRWRNTLQKEDIPHSYMKLSDRLSMVGGICWPPGRRPGR